jgi:hypothetical protein
MSLSLLSLLFVSAPAHAGDEVLPAPKPMLLVQTWATLMDQDQGVVADPGGYGDPEDDPGFKMRRVRMGFEGKNDQVKYGVTAGMSSAYDAVAASRGHDAHLDLVDAYGGFSPAKGVWMVGGVQKVPVSREALISSGNLTFTERAVSTEWLTPGRDIGAVIDGRWKAFRLRVGAFNGSGDLQGDDNNGKLLAARAEGSIGSGKTYRTFGTVDELTIGVGVDGWMNDQVAVKTQGMGADIIVRFEGLALLAEARMVSAAPKEDLVVTPGVFAETSRQGVMAQLGYTVGSLEPAVRFSTLDDDTNIEDSGDVSEILGGVTWHSDKDQVRAGAGYAVRNETGGNVVPNDTLRAWFQFKL